MQGFACFTLQIDLLFPWKDFTTLEWIYKPTTISQMKLKKAIGTWMTDFVEYKRDESSQQSKTNESNKLSPEYVVGSDKEFCSIACKVIPTGEPSGAGSSLVAVSFKHSSDCFSLLILEEEMLPSGTQKPLRFL